MSSSALSTSPRTVFFFVFISPVYHFTFLMFFLSFSLSCLVVVVCITTADCNGQRLYIELYYRREAKVIDCARCMYVSCALIMNFKIKKC